jgi:quinolinate synthase
VWLGECHVHKEINPHTLERMRHDHPQAEVLVHPECGCAGQLIYAMGQGDIPAEGVHIASTERMIQLVKERAATEFIVATETGIMHRMEQLAPDKQFFAADRAAVCAYMKTITLERTLEALVKDQFHVSVAPAIAARARAALDRMVALGPGIAKKPGD